MSDNDNLFDLPISAIIKVGRLVELTESDRVGLWTATQVMYQAARTQDPGWLSTYLREYLLVGKILRRALERSHATS